MGSKDVEVREKKSESDAARSPDEYGVRVLGLGFKVAGFGIQDLEVRSRDSG